MYLLKAVNQHAIEPKVKWEYLYEKMQFFRKENEKKNCQITLFLL
jgi:hypothetical protein